MATRALKYVIFLTDGNGYWNESAIDYAKQNGVTIYTFGLGAGVNSTLLQHIAECTNGKYFFARQADELQGAFDRTAQETTNGCSDEDSDHNGLSDYLEKKG